MVKFTHKRKDGRERDASRMSPQAVLYHLKKSVRTKAHKLARW